MFAFNQTNQKHSRCPKIIEIGGVDSRSDLSILNYGELDSAYIEKNVTAVTLKSDQKTILTQIRYPVYSEAQHGHVLHEDEYSDSTKHTQNTYPEWFGGVVVHPGSPLLVVVAVAAAALAPV